MGAQSAAAQELTENAQLNAAGSVYEGSISGRPKTLSDGFVPE